MMGNEEEQQCHECNKSLSRSKHLVSISGQSNQWHPECFKCNVCLRVLDRDTSCHLYRDKIICREDYLKLRRDLTSKCSRCHWPIGASDWVSFFSSLLVRMIIQRKLSSIQLHDQLTCDTNFPSQIWHYRSGGRRSMSITWPVSVVISVSGN